jgi:hypothetical protein
MEKKEQHARDLALDYAVTFGSDAGKRVLADLANRCREDDPSFIPGLESWMPAYRDGAKSVVKYIRLQLSQQPNTQLTPTIKK